MSVGRGRPHRPEERRRGIAWRVVQVPPGNEHLCMTMPQIGTGDQWPFVGADESAGRHRAVGVVGQPTVNVAVDVAVPPLVVTAILPVVAPLGTLVVIVVLDTTVYVAAMPLKVTVAPVTYPVPVMVTVVPPTVEPVAGANEVTVGTGAT